MTKVRSARGGFPRFRKIVASGSLPFASLHRPVRAFFDERATEYTLMPVPDGVWVKVNYRLGHLRDIQMQSTQMAADVTKQSDLIVNLPKKLKHLSDCSIVGIITIQKEPHHLEPGNHYGESALDVLDRNRATRELLLNGSEGGVALEFHYLYNHTDAPQEAGCYESLRTEHAAARRDGFTCESRSFPVMATLPRSRALPHRGDAEAAGACVHYLYDKAEQEQCPLMGVLFLPGLQTKRFNPRFLERRDELSFIQTLP